MTVPKISDHHHLLQAPANQLSVLPKKKCRSAISQKKERDSQFFSIRAERELGCGACIFVSAFWNHFSAQRRRAPRFTVRSKLWATRMTIYRAEIRSASSGRRTIIFIFCWLLANHKVQKSHQNHRIVEPRKIFWRVAAAQALSSRCRFSTKATEYWGAWGADLLCRVADAEAELQNLDSAAVCWWRSSTRQHQVLDIRFKVIIVMC